MLPIWQLESPLRRPGAIWGGEVSGTRDGDKFPDVDKLDNRFHPESIPHTQFQLQFRVSAWLLGPPGICYLYLIDA